jgi:hypothetical protein
MVAVEPSDAMVSDHGHYSRVQIYTKKRAAALSQPFCGVTADAAALIRILRWRQQKGCLSSCDPIKKGRHSSR